MTDTSKIEKKLSETLKPSRYRHTLGVSYTACALAMAYGINTEKAYMAGLLHDCAKCMSDEELFKYCLKHNIFISEDEKRSPHLLHAKAGAYMAEKDYSCNDPEILEAIKCHTTGKAAMNDLEKVLFTADYIEPGRYKAKNLDTIRYTAFRDLDECVYMILKETLDYLRETVDNIDRNTVTAYEYYRDLRKEKMRRNLFE